MSEQEDLFVDRTPRRRRATRWARRTALPAIGRHGLRLAVPAFVTAAVFGGVAVTASSSGPVDSTTSLGNVQPIDYKEECQGEGCNTEELKEMWATYEHECNDEGCWVEEVIEISGGPSHVTEPWRNNELTEMFRAFETKLNKHTMYPMRAGFTEDVWRMLATFLDGRIIMSPEFDCDSPLCGSG